MEILTALCIAVVGAALGYFLNIYVVFGITILAVAFFIYEGKTGRPTNGTSGHMGGMILAFIIYVIFFGPMTIMSVIVNWTLIASWFQTLLHGLAAVFLR